MRVLKSIREDLWVHFLSTKNLFSDKKYYFHSCWTFGKDPIIINHPKRLDNMSNHNKITFRLNSTI